MSAEEGRRAVLRAVSLTCVRGGRTLFSALSFGVEPGRALILRGPNGCGKTSLLRIIAGLLSPDEGEIRWGTLRGQEAKGALQENINLVGHSTALKPVLSVADNISIWARLHGGGDKSLEALGAMDLLALADLPVRYLSEGQKRRTALARLIAIEKPIWLLDEPLAGLDKSSTGRLIDGLDGHLSGGGIAVIATHQDIALGESKQRSLLIGAGS